MRFYNIYLNKNQILIQVQTWQFRQFHHSPSVSTDTRWSRCSVALGSAIAAVPAGSFLADAAATAPPEGSGGRLPITGCISSDVIVSTLKRLLSRRNILRNQLVREAVGGWTSMTGSLDEMERELWSLISRWMSSSVTGPDPVLSLRSNWNVFVKNRHGKR